MKRTMKFEFDTSNNDDLAKMHALESIASVMDNADHLKGFLQCARAIQLGRRIEIMPPEGEGAAPTPDKATKAAPPKAKPPKAK